MLQGDLKRMFVDIAQVGGIRRGKGRRSGPCSRERTASRTAA
jgi:hypothetical protein